MTNFGLGLGMNAFGGILNSVATMLAQDAMKNAISDQLAKQKGYANESMGVFSGLLPKLSAETAAGAIQKGSEHRQSVYSTATSTPASISKGPKMTKRDEGAVAMQGQQLANLSGYSDWQLGQMIDKIRAQEQLNRVYSLAGGQLSLLPYQMNDAQHSMDWLSALGGATSSAGNVVGMWDFLKQPNNKFATGLTYND